MIPRKSLFIFLLLSFLSFLGLYLHEQVSKDDFENKFKKDPIVFYNLKEQTVEFIDYHYSIKLTEAEEKVMKKALTQIPAPCYSDYTAYTCCCDCNLARSIWS